MITIFLLIGTLVGGMLVLGALMELLEIVGRQLGGEDE